MALWHCTRAEYWTTRQGEPAGTASVRLSAQNFYKVPAASLRGLLGASLPWCQRVNWETFTGFTVFCFKLEVSSHYKWTLDPLVPSRLFLDKRLSLGHEVGEGTQAVRELFIDIVHLCLDVGEEHWLLAVDCVVAHPEEFLRSGGLFLGADQEILWYIVTQLVAGSLNKPPNKNNFWLWVGGHNDRLGPKLFGRLASDPKATQVPSRLNC